MSHPRSSMLTLFWMVVVAGSLGCTAVRTIPDRPESRRARLVLKVEPARAELYVDGAYRGRISRWVDGVVPVDPGRRRIAIRADGYITRRFEYRLKPGETRRLTLEMEPRLDRIEPSERPGRESAE